MQTLGFYVNCLLFYQGDDGTFDVLTNPSHCGYEIFPTIQGSLPGTAFEDDKQKSIAIYHNSYLFSRVTGFKDATYFSNLSAVGKFNATVLCVTDFPSWLVSLRYNYDEQSALKTNGIVDAGAGVDFINYANHPATYVLKMTKTIQEETVITFHSQTETSNKHVVGASVSAKIAFVNISVKYEYTHRTTKTSGSSSSMRNINIITVQEQFTIGAGPREIIRGSVMVKRIEDKVVDFTAIFNTTSSTGKPGKEIARSLEKRGDFGRVLEVGPFHILREVKGTVRFSKFSEAVLSTQKLDSPINQYCISQCGEMKTAFFGNCSSFTNGYKVVGTSPAVAFIGIAMVALHIEIY